MRWLSASLSFVLFFETLPVRAQETAPGKLNIVVVEGEGAINNIRQRVAREPIVQVEDENHRPVAGAAVVFTLPNQGASGVFPNGSKTFTTLTDSQGRAVARGLRPNTVQGRVEIHVNASHQGRTASTTIVQTNMLAAAAGAAGATTGAGIGLKLVLLVSVVAAAAAGGIVAGTRTSGSTPAAVVPSPSAAISAGSGTVGAPPR